MTETIQVEAARIPDRDRLLDALLAAGLDAKAENEVGIAVPIADGGGEELFHTVEGIVLSVGAPFVPTKHEGVIYIRPPVG
jgi:hypothetical protein